jgi:RNA polymerase sigma-70 factor (ECF subfamily)
VLALREGQAAALNEIIARWQRPLLAFAYRYTQNHADAHDLVAITFTRLYVNREKLRADTNLSAWLFTILTNLCRNHRRWQSRHPTVSLDEVLSPENPSGSSSREPMSAAPAPHDALVEDETAKVVRAAIDRLPHDFKVALLLHHYEHLPYREIAAIVGCSERGVETRLYRARQLLKDSLASLIGESLTSR